MAAKTTTGLMSICKQCTQPIEQGVSCVACEGFCSNAFHVECVKFSIDELVCYRKLPNVWWICEECRIVMQEIRSNRSTTDEKKEMDSSPPSTCMELDRFDKEIAALKEQIAEIHQTLVDVSSVHATTRLDAVSTELPLAQSSMLHSSNLMYGTKNAGSLDCSSNESSSPDRIFWLFFTRIKNSVTEREMLKMIGDCLDTDDIVVRKLVPAWRDTSTMPYISFKVGINVRFKGVALCPTTWPAGICFREFRENIWEPPH